MASQKLERERKELEELIIQRLERASYETKRASKQYQLVEPENRLVARQLEIQWEKKLLEEKKIEEELEEFKAKRPERVTEKEREEIYQLSKKIPSLWYAQTTTDRERQAIIRQLVEKVIVTVIGESEKVKVEIRWAGGFSSEEIITRPVRIFEQLSYYDELKEQLKKMQQKGLSSGQMAKQLNKEGFKPVKRRETFNATMVRSALVRMGLTSVTRSKKRCEGKVKKNEWWLPDLAKRLKMPHPTVYVWIKKGWIKGRQLEGKQGRWVLWADQKEVKRLEEMRAQPFGHWSRKYWFDHLKEKKSHEKTLS